MSAVTYQPLTTPRAAPASRARARVTLFLLLAGSAAAAQEAVTPEAVAVRYEVELLVFRHLDQRGSTPEVELPRAAAPAEAGPLPALPGTGVDPAAAGAAWPALDPATLKLGNVAARLRRGGPYELLFHGGWTQEVTSQARAVPVALPADAIRSGAGGAVTLYRERYLHALVDVGLAAADGRADALRWIRQGRRLRGTAIHYFDNPAIGVMLAVRPVEALAGAVPTQ